MGITSTWHKWAHLPLLQALAIGESCFVERDGTCKKDEQRLMGAFPTCVVMYLCDWESAQSRDRGCLIALWLILPVWLSSVR